MRQGEQLTVTLEAIDVSNDRLLWQANVTAGVNDLISLQNKLTTQVQQGLLPVLGGGGGELNTASRPKNPEAYDLYLHSLAISHDVAQNKDAIAVLEHVVGEDPSYAPAWDALGYRYYYDSYYGGGGEEIFQRSNRAYEKALALDPNRVDAASSLIAHRVERGELGRAYAAATDLVRRRPQSADAHFALSYVLRYAGMQEQSTQECNTARSGELQLPVVRMGVSRTEQDRRGDGLRASGRGYGMGSVGIDLRSFGRGECGPGTREREEHV
jgi:tetratricopeptide (TPR) repeat protein